MIFTLSLKSTGAKTQSNPYKFYKRNAVALGASRL